jgi:16S rRNA (uracil1498-N3)-methyltransferase
MRIPNIYTESLLSTNSEVELDANAAQHIAKVLRMKKGFKLKLFNGDGFYYDAELTEVDRRSVRAAITERSSCETESKLETHLAIVVSRGDRMDYAIQKATELGINSILPLTSERCEVKLSDEREDKRLKRWQQVAISACEQCGRARVPTIHAIQTLEEFISDPQINASLKLVLHHRDTQDLSSISPPPTSVCMLIGPEGGLTSDEIDAARNRGFKACTLGPRVFRTETAPVAALSVLQWLWGDFQ